MTSIDLATGILTALSYIGNKLVLFIILLLVARYILQIVLDYFTIGYDDSDNKTTKERSGLNVHTDYKTGLQYIATPDGGLIKRLNTDGSHMKTTGE